MRGAQLTRLLPLRIILFRLALPAVPNERRVLLTDAMTSGGLLVAVPPERSPDAPGTRIGVLATTLTGMA